MKKIINRPYCDAEIRQILEAAGDADIPIAVAVQLTREAKIRRDELFTVKWSHVDNTSHTVSIPRSGEVDSVARKVAISEQLTGSLEKLKGRNPDSEYVFEGLNASSLSLKFKRLCEKAGVPYRGLHSLRRSRIYQMLV